MDGNIKYAKVTIVSSQQLNSGMDVVWAWPLPKKVLSRCNLFGGNSLVVCPSL